MEHDDRFDNLEHLGEWSLEDENQDIRGSELVDRSGLLIGIIEEMIVDLAQEEVVAVRLEDRQACGVEHLEIEDQQVFYRPAPLMGAERPRFSS